MNYYLEKHDINLILDALENYRKIVEDGILLGDKFAWTIFDVDDLMDNLSECDN